MRELKATPADVLVGGARVASDGIAVGVYFGGRFGGDLAVDGNSPIADERLRLCA